MEPLLYIPREKYLPAGLSESLINTALENYGFFYEGSRQEIWWIDTENIVESKHHKLARSLRSGPTDRDLKPNAATRDLLHVIVEYPPTKPLNSEEGDLIWKFRFYLSNQKKALTKFLKSVNWDVAQEVKQALELLNKWSPMDVADALELLTPSFNHPAVRKYAITRLRQADD